MVEYQPLMFDGTLCQQSYREMSIRRLGLIPLLVLLPHFGVLFRVDGTARHAN